MQEHILVPLDGSALAETALPAAARLARMTGCALTLLRVVEPPIPHSHLAWPTGGPVSPIRSDDTDHALCTHYLQQVAERLRAPDLAVTTAVRDGEPAGSIVEYAHQHPAITRIAMATHGRSGVNRMVFGSVAEKVRYGTTIPLLLVHAGDPAGSPAAYGTILVPLDAAVDAAPALQVAQALAAPGGATVLLVTVLPPVADLAFAEARTVPFWTTGPGRQVASQATQALIATAEQLKAQGVRVRTRLAEGSAAAEIRRVAQEEGAELIVLATRDRGTLAQTWHHSVAWEVARDARLPVLLIHTPAPGAAVVPAAPAGAVYPRL